MRFQELQKMPLLAERVPTTEMTLPSEVYDNVLESLAHSDPAVRTVARSRKAGSNDMRFMNLLRILVTYAIVYVNSLFLGCLRHQRCS